MSTQKEIYEHTFSVFSGLIATSVIWYFSLKNYSPYVRN